MTDRYLWSYVVTLFFSFCYCTLVTYVNWRLLILSHLHLANLQLSLFGNTRNNEETSITFNMSLRILPYTRNRLKTGLRLSFRNASPLKQKNTVEMTVLMWRILRFRKKYALIRMTHFIFKIWLYLWKYCNMIQADLAIFERYEPKIGSNIMNFHIKRTRIPIN